MTSTPSGLAELVTRDSMIGVGRPLPARRRQRWLRRSESTPTSRAGVPAARQRGDRVRGAVGAAGVRDHVALCRSDACEWEDFRQRLIARIAEAETRPYWESWAAALEDVLADSAMLALTSSMSAIANY